MYQTVYKGYDMHRIAATSQSRPLGHVTQRLLAVTALALTPVIAYVLGKLAWDQAHTVIAGLPLSSASNLATISLGQALSPVAAATGALVAAHLTWTTLVMLATPRESRIRAAAAAVTPTAWRRLVTIAATGALSAGLAVPATAAVATTAVDTTDAGWVSAPVEATTEQTAHTPEATSQGRTDGAQQTSASDLLTETHDNAQATSAREVVVSAGDTLWDITATQLDLDRGDHAAIATSWPQLYDQNRAAIGDDPGLIVPDQRLTIPTEWNA